jgi:tetratricopeptide (TPR) repeat protein
MHRCRRILLLAAGLAWIPLLHAADVASLLQQARAAEDRFDTRTALALFLQADAARPNDPVILQKISRQYSDSTAETADVAEKKRLCIEALAYAKRAAELAPRNAVNVLSVAICYGKLALYSDTRTKIEYSRFVKEYAEQALALDPNYDYAHHVLGRWNYEVASLGLGARVIVRLIYGGLPPASTAEAVRQLQRAVELSPHRPAHRVELGFALLADGRRDAARRTFEEALAMPQVEKYDTESFRRAREALADLR